MAGQSNGPWDAGLQSERTTLAWLRTALSFVVAAMVLIRLAAHSSVALAAGCALALLPLGFTITAMAWRRHRHVDRSLRADIPLPDATLHAALTALAVLVGSAGVAYTMLT